MKKFKLNVDTGKVNIIKLLNAYSSFLSLDSGGVLSGLVGIRVIKNKIIYDFEIKYGDNVSCKIFEICVLDLLGNISVTIFYFKDIETFFIKDDELENKIDEIISSDKMGDFVGYLVLMNSKQ
jgi:hypothetical protein